MADEFLKPSKILDQLDLKEDMTAADFGCGSGGWALPLAKKLEEGKVYAIDILEGPLSVLKSKAKVQKIINIETMLADVERGVGIPNETCDLVLMTNLLFECDDKKKVLEEGKRVLKWGGKILMIDWIKDNPLTKQIEFVSFDDIKSMATELGLKIIKEFPAGSYHHGVVFIK